MWRPRSLQARLTLLVTAALAALWLATALVTWFDARDELDELLDGHLAQAAALLVVQQVGELSDGEERERAVEAPTLHRYAPKVAFQVFHEGRLVMRSAQAPSMPLVRIGREGDGFSTAVIDGHDWRVFSARGAERDVQVVVAEELPSRRAILGAVLRAMLWPLALALPLVGLATWWAVRQGTAPLRQLGLALHARDPSALQPVALDQAPSEVQPLVDALNALFARIASLLDTERRFTADAAHELRTPIAAIRTQAQVAAGETSDGPRQHALQATIEGCDRAARLIDQMLMLARVESGDAPSMQSLDLGALAQRVIAGMVPAALPRRQALSLDEEGSMQVRGNDMLLAVLLRNLIDNALRYGTDGMPVEVRLRGEDRDVVLAVEDGGPGLPADAIARLGERFFRPPGLAASGSGLGWSIVRRIAEAHGATIDVARSERLGGLRCTLRLPRG
jgi:two-component system sensor histidine kinase QseC